MRAQGNPDSIEGMLRQFGINVEKGFGLNVPQIRAIARGVIKTNGRDQTLAEHLWRSGIHDARILATFIADPLKISRTTMDRWAADCNSWDICDACSYGLFDATPHAIPKIHKWAKDEPNSCAAPPRSPQSPEWRFTRKRHGRSVFDLSATHWEICIR